MAVAMLILGLSILILAVVVIVFFILYGITTEEDFGAICATAGMVLLLCAIAEAILAIVNFAQNV